MNPIVCYHCGQEGHKSFQCPHRSLGGGGEGRGFGGRGRRGDGRTLHPRAGALQMFRGGFSGGFGAVTKRASRGALVKSGKTNPLLELFWILKTNMVAIFRLFLL